MKFRVKRSSIGVGGRIKIPGSKSHTIRSLFFASLAGGRSAINSPLVSSDALSAVEACMALGAKVEKTAGGYAVEGFGGRPSTPENVIDVGNSGTTLRIAVSTAALGEQCAVFTGDYQIRRRPLGPLVRALNDLGAEVFTTRGNGSAPVVVRGRLKGGRTSLEAVSSQFLTSLLINCPLADADTEIELTVLNEVPYAQMTLWWLDRLGIKYENRGFKSVLVKGGQTYKPFDITIPGDFSSATFFAVLAAISGAEITMENLDMTDTQGDKRVLAVLEGMGAKVSIRDGLVTVKGDGLKGAEIDMNDIPDALPAMAVAGCFAEGETRLLNVPQARLKETDRIHVMAGELSKMGADITELKDGLVVRKSKLTGREVSGHDDHRIVMALVVAGLCSAGETVIGTAEAAGVTFPEFKDLVKACGGKLEEMD